MSNELFNHNHTQNKFSADCEKCFGLCCVALPYAKSADFAFNKDGGTPCQNLNADYRCSIHKNLRNNGLRGCTVYDCFGAGQKISQVTYNGKSWRDDPAIAEEMFNILPIMQQLHEMLYYLNEALGLEEAQPIYTDLQEAMAKTEQLTDQAPTFLLDLYVPTHRALVNDLLLQTSELVRKKVNKNMEHSKYGKKIKRKDLMGANLRGANLRGTNLRGVLLIAADLREADMRMTDLIGADFRDADLSGANLEGSIFLTQAQLNSAKGNRKTKIPSSLSIPSHWLH
ncbi:MULTISPECIES: pentapeptide repeat-containing protein [Paenibacillus]|uniref:Uncharacterized protein YjbI with pentapeptide repeats n=1 Tax=Paenibacillus brasilensis TaxID=128574 RepID=A0ABU0L497_9BACL|nr:MULTISPECIES: pentapeptide repeat-containing protein [Paenibacillus]MDQ0496102.1 uncharacterized protein YjbI with pentapeptide repeats [Paenibacillus brasilensis]